MQARETIPPLRWGHEFGSPLSSSPHQGGVRSNRGLMVPMWKQHHLFRGSPKTKEKCLRNIFTDRVMCSGTNIFNNVVTVSRVMNFTVRIGGSGKREERKREGVWDGLCLLSRGEVRFNLLRITKPLSSSVPNQAKHWHWENLRNFFFS